MEWIGKVAKRIDEDFQRNWRRYAMAAAAAAVAGVVLSIAVNFVVIEPELRVYEARTLGR